MCGVIGFFSNEPKNSDKELLKKVFNESRVRGMHSYGIAYGFNKKPLKIYKTYKIKEALEIINDEDYNLLIGHTRYGTSGDWKILENNQPLCLGNDILAFNGVIRMSTKEEYEKEFKQKYITENDGEIILSFLKEGKILEVNKLLESNNVSYAGIHYLKFTAYIMKNYKRPLWEIQINNAKFITSTIDIMKRASNLKKLNSKLIESNKILKLC